MKLKENKVYLVTLPDGAVLVGTYLGRRPPFFRYQFDFYGLYNPETQELEDDNCRTLYVRADNVTAAELQGLETLRVFFTDVERYSWVLSAWHDSLSRYTTSNYAARDMVLEAMNRVLDSQ